MFCRWNFPINERITTLIVRAKAILVFTLLIMQLLALLLASSVSMMASAVISPALPRIAEAFADSDPHGIKTRLLLTAPSLVTIFAAPLAGFFADRWKRTPILIMGLLLFALFGSAGLWVSDLDHLYYSRLLLGVAVGMLISTSSSLMGDYYTGTERNKAMGFQGMSNALGGVVLMGAGGALGGISWRGPFGIYLLGIIFAVFAFLWLPEPVKQGSTSADDINDSKHPQKTRWTKIILVYVSGLIAISCFFLIPVNAAFVLKARFGMSGVTVGLVMATSTLSTAVLAMQYAKVRKALGEYGTFVLTFVGIGLAMWILSWANSLPIFLLGMLVNGVGLGCMFPHASASVLAACTPQMRGRAMGLLSSFFYLGQFLSPVFTAWVEKGAGSIDSVFKMAAIVAAVMATLYMLASLRATGTSAAERA